MFDFSKICKEFENMSDSDRKATLARDSAVILPALSSLNGDGTLEFLLFVMTSCAADGRLDREEYKLFCDVTGIALDYNTACEMVSAATQKESRNAVDMIVDIFGLLNDDIKASMISFCLCFCAANGKIDGKEKRFIKKLIK